MTIVNTLINHLNLPGTTQNKSCTCSVSKFKSRRLRRSADAYTLRVLRKALATYGVDEAMTEAHGHMSH